MNTWIVIFWISFAVLAYTYVGYPLLLSIFSLLRSTKKAAGNPEFPDVTLLVMAYNEEEVIEEKIRNSFALDYPREQLKFMIITDGSTDNTPKIVSSFPEVKLLHQEKRLGKTGAINRAMQFVKTPFVVFCDANTSLNKDCMQQLIKHFNDPKIGGVAGEKRIKTLSNEMNGVGESWYWKYESFVKRSESDFNSLVGAAGELFAIRSALYTPVDEK